MAALMPSHNEMPSTPSPHNHKQQSREGVCEKVCHRGKVCKVQIHVQLKNNEIGGELTLHSCQDLESKFDGWKEDLTHLTVLRESLCSYISPEDLRVLQERTELLHRQWEEICHQVHRPLDGAVLLHMNIIVCAADFKITKGNSPRHHRPICSIGSSLGFKTHPQIVFTNTFL